MKKKYIYALVFLLIAIVLFILLLPSKTIKDGILGKPVDVTIAVWYRNKVLVEERGRITRYYIDFNEITGFKLMYTGVLKIKDEITWEGEKYIGIFKKKFPGNQCYILNWNKDYQMYVLQITPVWSLYEKDFILFKYRYLNNKSVGFSFQRRKVNPLDIEQLIKNGEKLIK